MGEGALRLLWPLGEGSQPRTMADLGEQESIGPEHVAEAIRYRSFDRAPRR